jgi:hypothetical protein
MEIWDLYNWDREVIGEHIRGKELPQEGFHLVVHVWIKNSEGKYLMTQRSAKRRGYRKQRSVRSARVRGCP